MTRIFPKLILFFLLCGWFLPVYSEANPEDLKSAVLKFYDTYDSTVTTLYWKYPDLFRMEAVGKSGSDVVVLNGKKSWLTSKDGFRIPSEEEQDAMMRRLALLAFRFDFKRDAGRYYKDKGSILFGGEKCRKLKGTYNLTMIVSEKERRPRKITFPLNRWKTNTADTVFFDWEDFGKVKLPRLTFASAEGETTKRLLLSAEFDVPIADTLFGMPEIFEGKEETTSKDGFSELLNRPHAELMTKEKKAQKIRYICVPGGRVLPMPRLAAVKPGALIFASNRSTVRIPADRLTAAEQKKYNCTPDGAKREAELLKKQLKAYEEHTKALRKVTDKVRQKDRTFPDEGDVLKQAQLVKFLQDDIGKAFQRIAELEEKLKKEGIIPFVPGMHGEFMILFFTGVNTYNEPKSLKNTGLPLIIPVQRTADEIASDDLAAEREGLDRLKVQYEREVRFLESMRHWQYEKKLAEKALKEKQKAEKEKKLLADKVKRKQIRDARRKAAEKERNPEPAVSSSQKAPAKQTAEPGSEKKSLWNPLNWF